MNNDSNNTKREYNKTKIAMFSAQLGSTSDSVTDTLVEFAKANIDLFDSFADSAGSLVAVGRKGRKADPNKVVNKAAKAIKDLDTNQLIALLQSQGISISL